MRFSVVAVGIVFTILSLFAYTYIVNSAGGSYLGIVEAENTEAPYRDFSFTLFLIGIAVVIIGLALGPAKEEKIETPSTNPASSPASTTIAVETQNPLAPVADKNVEMPIFEITATEEKILP
jgi:hypothetical protein